MKTLSFPTKADALRYLRSIPELEESTQRPGVFWRRGLYYLNHGEYSRPEYSVRRYKDGWGIHAAYFYYAGTLYAPRDGRILYNPWC